MILVTIIQWMTTTQDITAITRTLNVSKLLRVTKLHRLKHYLWYFSIAPCRTNGIFATEISPHSRFISFSWLNYYQLHLEFYVLWISLYIWWNDYSPRGPLRRINQMIYLWVSWLPHQVIMQTIKDRRLIWLCKWHQGPVSVSYSEQAQAVFDQSHSRSLQ